MYRHIRYSNSFMVIRSQMMIYLPSMHEKHTICHIENAFLFYSVYVYTGTYMTCVRIMGSYGKHVSFKGTINPCINVSIQILCSKYTYVMCGMWSFRFDHDKYHHVSRILNPTGFLLGGLKPSTTNVHFPLLGFHWVFVEYWVFIRGSLGFTS